MCGRYTLTVPGDLLAAAFGVEAAAAGPVAGLPARYNVAPGQQVPIVRRREDGGRDLALARWGLVPHWAKESAIGNRMINARGESVAEKPSFRTAFRRHRCLVPADGFYEWQATAGGKQPWLLRLRGGELFAFAGLESRWIDPATREPLDTCAIVTTAPNELAATVHDRMPVILAPADYALWLGEAGDGRDPAALLAPIPADRMEAWPVSRQVNRPAVDDPSLLLPAAG